MTRTLPVRRTSAGWVVHAPAKVNVLLEVLGKRSDGYHELRTLMCPVRLGDTLVLRTEPGAESSIHLTVRSGLPPQLGAAPPSDDRNLVHRALRTLFAHCGITPNCSVLLTKRTPLQAGLGGGSSDAAAALVAANQAWGLNLSQATLIEVAARVGSDVPGMLFAQATLCEGRGERVTPVPLPAGLPVVLAKPREGLSTAAVFGGLQRLTQSASDRLEKLLDSLRHGRLQEAARHMANHLQPPAEHLCAAVSCLLGMMASRRMPAVQMTGSGSACFGLCHHHTQASRIASWLTGRGVGWAAATCTC